ncbi:MAG TPA: DUF5916 domain-containing protein [Terriglobales bacterium]
MQPTAEWKGKLARLTGFIQRLPDDGRPPTQQTDAYLGYDSRALHIVFVAHDAEPAKIRARLDHRESIGSDEDQVGIYIDTFRDRHRAYQFECNPLGVQDDSFYSEDTLTADEGFDTVWTSQGQITHGGYVVVMSIPFKSLRFSHQPAQTWNVALWRFVGRRLEGSWWPRVSSRYRGFLSQAAPVSGLENISPGRNLQFNPYISWRAFHQVDARDPASPVYRGRSAEVVSGVDAKAILKDSLVLDLTVKPDFSQVESDQPQINTNQRYELFYPEKRPFFTENANYFEAPMVVPTQHLLFTRRIAQPDFGARLTGKLGHYSIGALVADDRSPGESVPVSDPAAGKHALFDVFRVTRDLPSRSNVGVSFAERSFAGSYSRLVDLDTTFGMGRTWIGTILGGYNWNRGIDGSTSSGTTLDATLNRTARGFNYTGYFLNRAPGFQPAMSFYSHSDWREVGQTFAYQFWPNHSWINRIWTEVYAVRSWHYDGVKNFEGISPLIKVDVRHNTTISAYAWSWRDVLGPKDSPLLKGIEYLPLVPAYGASIQSTQLRFLNLKLSTEWGIRTNVTPASGQVPAQAHYRQAEADVTLQTSRGLSIANTYLFDRNTRLQDGRAIYNSHTLRSQWNWQLNRELSVRIIGQYSAVLTSPLLTATPTSRGLNADFLISYLVHPGTALYVGYNSNLSKPGPAIAPFDSERFANDGRQFFVKLSYLFRF